jgi:non-specific serine/threonine protein kinase
MTRGIRASPGIGRLADEPTSFVNRRREIAEVKGLLGKNRLLTLTGVGGTGKTRLAVRVAGELRRAFADGVWQVELAGLTDGAVLEYVVADALGLWAAADVPVRRLLTDYLAERQMLIVMDNCEHLLDACAALIGALLPAAADLRVLCTSRQPLGMIGEAGLVVQPLARPGSGEVVDDDLTGHAAVDLFVERAAAAWPDFALSAGNQALVVDICDRLDGLPLAIELAAAQLRTRSVEQLARDLVDRFALTAVRPTGPVHHYRLRDAFDWSFELCTPQERALWARAAVFCGGGFDLDAVTEVCAGPELPAGTVLAAAVGLIDQSVLERREVAGRSRYHMLETVRGYGLERLRTLDPAAEVGLGRRHRDWYLRLAERFAADWFGPRQPELLALLRLEWSNLRTAIDFSLTAPGEALDALRLTGALGYYWLAGGQREGRHWLDRALAVDHGPTAPRTRALFWYSRVLLTSSNQDRDQAVAAARECLALARHLDDPSLLANAHHALGLCAQMAGQPQRARALLDQAVTGYAEAGELNVNVIAARVSFAGATLALGDRAEASRILGRCYTDCAAHGEQWARTLALQWLAFDALDAGDLDRAGGYAEERLRIKRALDDTLGIQTSLKMISAVAAAAGRYERAGHLLGAAEQIRERFGARDLVTSSPLGVRLEQGRAASLAALGDSRYEAAVRLGASADQDAAIAYALGEQPDLAPRAPAREDTVDPGPLTRRERQVAELIAKGLTNKQIASRLAIGPRTVEAHVENILAKLRFRSRTQVAGWVARQQR